MSGFKFTFGTRCAPKVSSFSNPEKAKLLISLKFTKYFIAFVRPINYGTLLVLVVLGRFLVLKADNNSISMSFWLLPWLYD